MTNAQNQVEKLTAEMTATMTTIVEFTKHATLMTAERKLLEKAEAIEHLLWSTEARNIKNQSMGKSFIKLSYLRDKLYYKSQAYYDAARTLCDMRDKK